MSVVAQRYGYSVQYEVMNDKVGQAFAEAANEAKLRVAGAPQHHRRRKSAPEGQMAFDATFEVYPEVKLGDLAAAEVERVSHRSDRRRDRQARVDILRKQRRTFAQRPAAEGAAESDRVTIDFEGKIDGEPFDGGKAEAFQFIIGEGQMLEQFDKAVRGMKVGETKTFPLQFPADYHGKDVAGKEADFLVTHEEDRGAAPARGRRGVRQVAGHHGRHGRRPARRRARRTSSARSSSACWPATRRAVMDALVKAAELDVPKALVDSEVERLVEAARADLKQRGVKDADNGADPGRDLQAAGRAPRAPGPGGGRTGARQQPAGQARAAAGPHRGDGAELREARPKWCAGTWATASAWPRSRRW